MENYTDKKTIKFQDVLTSFGYDTISAQLAIIRIMIRQGMCIEQAIDKFFDNKKACYVDIYNKCHPGKALLEKFQSFAAEKYTLYTDKDLWEILTTVLSRSLLEMRGWLVAAFQLFGLRSTFNVEKPAGSTLERWEEEARSLTHPTDLEQVFLQSNILTPLGLIKGYSWPNDVDAEPLAILIYGGLESTIVRRLNYLVHGLRFQQASPIKVLYPSNPRGLFNNEQATSICLAHWFMKMYPEKWTSVAVLENKIKKILQKECNKKYDEKLLGEASWVNKIYLEELKLSIKIAIGLEEKDLWPQQGYLRDIFTKELAEWKIFSQIERDYLLDWPTAFDAINYYFEQLCKDVPIIADQFELVFLPIYAKDNLTQQHVIANSEDSLLTTYYWCKENQVKQIIAITDNEIHQCRYQAAQAQALLDSYGIKSYVVGPEAKYWRPRMAIDNLTKTLYVQYIYGMAREQMINPTLQDELLTLHFEKNRHQVYSSLQEKVLVWPKTLAVVTAVPAPLPITFGNYGVINLPEGKLEIALLLMNLWQAYPDFAAMYKLLEKNDEISTLQNLYGVLSYNGSDDLDFLLPLVKEESTLKETARIIARLTTGEVINLNKPKQNITATLVLEQLKCDEPNYRWLLPIEEYPVFMDCAAHRVPQLFPEHFIDNSAQPVWIDKREPSKQQLCDTLKRELPLILNSHTYAILAENLIKCFSIITIKPLIDWMNKDIKHRKLSGTECCFYQAGFWYGIVQTLIITVPDKVDLLNLCFEQAEEYLKINDEQVLILRLRLAVAKSIFFSNDEEKFAAFKKKNNVSQLQSLGGDLLFEIGKYYESKGSLIEAQQAYERAYEQTGSNVEQGLALAQCYYLTGNWQKSAHLLKQLYKYSKTPDEQAGILAQQHLSIEAVFFQSYYLAKPITEAIDALLSNQRTGEAYLSLALSRCALMYQIEKYQEADRYFKIACKQAKILAQTESLSLEWQGALNYATAAMAQYREDYQLAYEASLLAQTLNSNHNSQWHWLSVWNIEWQPAQIAQGIASYSQEHQQFFWQWRALAHYSACYDRHRYYLDQLISAEKSTIDVTGHMALLNVWSQAAIQFKWVRQGWLYYWHAAKDWEKHATAYQYALHQTWCYHEKMMPQERSEVADALSAFYFPEEEALQCLSKALKYAKQAQADTPTDERRVRIQQLEKLKVDKIAQWGLTVFNQYMYLLKQFYKIQRLYLVSFQQSGQMSHRVKQLTGDLITHSANLLDHVYGYIAHEKMDLPADQNCYFPNKNSEKALMKQLREDQLACRNTLTTKWLNNLLEKQADACKAIWINMCIAAFEKADYINQIGDNVEITTKWKNDWKKFQKNYVEKGLSDLSNVSFSDLPDVFIPKSKTKFVPVLKEIKCNCTNYWRKNKIEQCNSFSKENFVKLICNYSPTLTAKDILNLLEKSGCIKKQIKSQKYEIIADKFFDTFKNYPSLSHFKITPKDKKKYIPIARLFLLYEPLISGIQIAFLNLRKEKEQLAEVIISTYPLSLWKTGKWDQNLINNWLNVLLDMHNETKHVKLVYQTEALQIERRFTHTLFKGKYHVKLSQTINYIHPWNFLPLLEEQMGSSKKENIQWAKKLYQKLNEKGFLKEGAPCHMRGIAYAKEKAKQGHSVQKEKIAFLRALDQLLNELAPHYAKDVEQGEYHPWCKPIGVWLLHRHLEDLHITFKPLDNIYDATFLLKCTLKGIHHLFNSFAIQKVLPIPSSNNVTSEMLVIQKIDCKTNILISPVSTASYLEWHNFMEELYKKVIFNEGMMSKNKIKQWPNWCQQAYYEWRWKVSRYQVVSNLSILEFSAKDLIQYYFSQELPEQAIYIKEELISYSPLSALRLDSISLELDKNVLVEVDEDLRHWIYYLKVTPAIIKVEWALKGINTSFLNQLGNYFIRAHHLLEQSWRRFIKGTVGLDILIANLHNNKHEELLLNKEYIKFPCLQNKSRLWRELRNSVAAPLVELAIESYPEKKINIYHQRFVKDNTMTLVYDKSDGIWKLWDADKTNVEFKVFSTEKLKLWQLPSSLEEVILRKNQIKARLNPRDLLPLLRESEGYRAYSIMDYPNGVQALLNSQPLADSTLTTLHWLEKIISLSNTAKHNQSLFIMPLAKVQNKSFEESLIAVYSARQLKACHLRELMFKVLKNSDILNSINIMLLAEKFYNFLKKKQKMKKEGFDSVLTLQKWLWSNHLEIAKTIGKEKEYELALQIFANHKAFCNQLWKELQADSPTPIEIPLFPLFEEVVRSVTMLVSSFSKVLREHEVVTRHQYRWAFVKSNNEDQLDRRGELILPSNKESAYAIFLVHFAPFMEKIEILSAALKKLGEQLDLNKKITTVDLKEIQLWLKIASNHGCRTLPYENDFPIVESWVSALHNIWRQQLSANHWTSSDYEAKWQDLGLQAKVSYENQAAYDRAQRDKLPVIWMRMTGHCTVWRYIPPYLKVSNSIEDEKALFMLLNYNRAKDFSILIPKIDDQAAWVKQIYIYFHYERGEPVYKNSLDSIVAKMLFKLLNECKDLLAASTIGALATRLAYYYHHQRTSADYEKTQLLCTNILDLNILETDTLLSFKAELLHHRGNSLLNQVWERATTNQQNQVINDLRCSLKLQCEQINLEFPWIKNDNSILDKPKKELNKLCFSYRTFGRALREFAYASQASFPVNKDGKKLSPRMYLTQADKILCNLEKMPQAVYFRKEVEMELLLLQDRLLWLRACEKLFPDDKNLSINKETYCNQAMRCILYIKNNSEIDHLIHSQQTAQLTLAELYASEKKWQTVELLLKDLNLNLNPEHQIRILELHGALAESKGLAIQAMGFYKQVLELQRDTSKDSRHIKEIKMRLDKLSRHNLIQWRYKFFIPKQLLVVEESHSSFSSHSLT